MIKDIPANPYAEARVISAKIDPEFHKQLREFAAKHDCLVSHVIKASLAQYLKAN
ncbi:hypothetical protein P0D88_01000 [Paraburkholderia sp. RL18-103-BIB-C]|uniref:hypothetical protein n=1 Tax=Paraburkholderia sp. RL18-103-BIB-C TaxID=3031637 RepID=UPI0038B79F9D